MRQLFLAEFDALWFDSMNGDSRETGKLTPEGRPDPSVFSTEYNREGIRVGTAIGLMVRRRKRTQQPIVRIRQFWGVTKRPDLLESLNVGDMKSEYATAHPISSNRLSFRSSVVGSDYLAWPKLTDPCAEAPGNGLMEKRGGALIEIEKTALEKRMRKYYDPTVDWETLKAFRTGLTKDAAGFDAKAVRRKVQAAEQFQLARIRRYALRPFETVGAITVTLVRYGTDLVHRCGRSVGKETNFSLRASSAQRFRKVHLTFSQLV